MSESKPVEKKCTAPMCSKTDMTEFSTCRHCGHRYADAQSWTAPTDVGAQIGEFLRSPFNVLISLILLGSAYTLITKRSFGDILGDAIGAVIRIGRKRENSQVRLCTSTLSQAPNNVEALEKRGDAYEELHEGKAAVADYTAAINLRPTAALYNKRAIAWDALGEHEKAKADNAEAKRLKK